MSHSAALGHVEVPVTYAKDEAVGVMQQAGVVGAGGAGFPTYVKWATPPHTLLVNAADSEPGYYADKLLLRDEPEAMVDVFEFLQETFSIEVVVVGAEEVARPYLGGLEELARRVHGFSIAYVPSKYKYGQEKALCKAVFGMDIPGKEIPPQHGVLVNNNESLFNVYRAEFQERPVVTKFLQVYGEIGPPKVFEAPIGASAADVIRAYGVEPADFAHCRLYDGGPILAELAADPMGPEPGHAVQKTTNGLLVVHPDKDRPRTKHYPDPSWERFHNSIDAPWAPGEIVNIEDRVRRVRVPLTGRFWIHGALTVAEGDRVSKGDTLARPKVRTDKFSIGVHASIDGRVTGITDEYVQIER